MKLITTAQLNEKCFAYILNAIDGSGYGRELITDKDKLQFLIDTFKSEYGWQAKRIGYLKAFNEWIQGLPSSFNIDYSYCDIIAIAKKWGSLPTNATKKQEDKVCENWFPLIANKSFQLMKKYKVLPQ